MRESYDFSFLFFIGTRRYSLLQKRVSESTSRSSHYSQDSSVITSSTQPSPHRSTSAPTTPMLKKASGRTLTSAHEYQLGKGQIHENVNFMPEVMNNYKNYIDITDYLNNI